MSYRPDDFKATFLHGEPRPRYTARDRQAMGTAEHFYEGKLESAPQNARYQHLLATLTAAKGDNWTATNFYRSSIASSDNVMARNDLALHIARTKNLRDPNNFKARSFEITKSFSHFVFTLIYL
jgi:hypothetical protein